MKTNSQQPDSTLPANHQASSNREAPGEKLPLPDSASLNLITVVHNSSSEPANVITHCWTIQVTLFHKDSPLKTVKLYVLL